MKKMICLVSVLLVSVVLTSCKRQTQSAEPITLFPKQQATQTLQTQQNVQKQESETEPTTVPQIVANSSYNTVQSEVDGVSVSDTGELYRTDDSYKFESQAVENAKKAFSQTLTYPETLCIQDANVWDCADDGKNVYYSVHLTVSYSVESGDLITRGFFYDVGIRKADGVSFDATEQMDTVLRQYSIYHIPTYNRNVSVLEGAEKAAELFATYELKNPEKAEFILASEDTETENVLCYRVLFKGDNDFGMHIPCVYKVHFIEKDGFYVEVDPSEIN